MSPKKEGEWQVNTLVQNQIVLSHESKVEAIFLVTERLPFTNWVYNLNLMGLETI